MSSLNQAYSLNDNTLSHAYQQAALSGTHISAPIKNFYTSLYICTHVLTCTHTWYIPKQTNQYTSIQFMYILGYKHTPIHMNAYILTYEHCAQILAEALVGFRCWPTLPRTLGQELFFSAEGRNRPCGGKIVPHTHATYICHTYMT